MAWRYIAGLLLSLIAGVWSTASVAASCSEILLGSVLSLTGTNSVSGAHAKRGFDHAVQTLRTGGGIRVGDRCYNFRIITYDDESIPNRGSELAERLARRDAVRFLMGPNTATVFERVAEVAGVQQIPLVQAFGVPSRMTTLGKGYVFTTGSPQLADVGLTIDAAARIAASVGRKATSLRIAIAYTPGPYYEELRSLALRRVSDYGMNVVMSEPLTSLPSEAGIVFRKIRSTNADLLLVLADARGTRFALGQIDEMQLRVPMVSMTNCEATDLQKLFSDAVTNVLCAAHRPKSLDHDATGYGNAEAFSESFRSRFPSYESRSLPSEVTLAASAVYILADAIRRAKIIDAEKVREALLETDLVTFHGRAKFDQQGRSTGPAMLLRQYRKERYLTVAPLSKATDNLQWPRTGF